MDVGLQFHLPSHPALTVPEIVDLGRIAADGGVRQLWVTDNLGSRNAFVVLAALASNVAADLGTAIMVQYFRNPVDAADALAAVTEVMDGDVLSVGIGRGNVRTPRFVQTPKPLSTMRETACTLRRLFDGGEVVAEDVPTLAEYFNWAPGASFRLKFPPARPVRVLCGGDGPKSLAIGGEHMDGLLCGTTFQPIAKMGYLESQLRFFDDAAANAARPLPLDRVVEIKISLTRDPAASRAFARRGVGSRVLSLRWRGYGAEDLARLGISEDDVERLERGTATTGGTSQELADLVTDAMIDAFYIAGDLGHCRDRVREICETAERHGFRQLLFSGISPEFEDGVRLLCDEIVPVVGERRN
jgi:alkanesulfonate monooxygenase SsuD/methylene tetrahydromethanopterin reductase-like flavin-dependent oxidoreductase (luciferase family)